MSSNAAAEAPAAAPGAEGEAPSKKKFDLSSKKVKVLALLLVVMGAQSAVVYLILPSPSDAAHGSATEGEVTAAAEPHGGGHGDGHGGGHSGGHKSTEEMLVSDFSSSVSTNGGGTIFFVTFKLYAIVPSSSGEEFSKLINESYKARINQAVVKVVRMSSMEDLNDPQLEVFKRNLRSEINNLLPQRFVEEVIVSEFRTMEQ